MPRLPLWAYAAALGGGFLASRLTAGAGTPVETPPADGAATEPGAAPATGLWDNWGDAGASFEGSQGIGVLPAPYQGPSNSDYMDAPTDYTTPPPVSAPPPPPTSSPPPPPPTSSPPPPPPPTSAPTGTLVARPRTSPPSGTVGWTVVSPGQAYRNPYLPWNGGYPVKLHAPVAYTGRTARWISGVRAGVDAGGHALSVRRVSHRDTVDGNWADDFVSSSVAVYPTSTGSVRV